MTRHYSLVVACLCVPLILVGCSDSSPKRVPRASANHGSEMLEKAPEVIGRLGHDKTCYKASFQNLELQFPYSGDTETIPTVLFKPAGCAEAYPLRVYGVNSERAKWEIDGYSLTPYQEQVILSAREFTSSWWGSVFMSSDTPVEVLEDPSKYYIQFFPDRSTVTGPPSEMYVVVLEKENLGVVGSFPVMSEKKRRPSE